MMRCDGVILADADGLYLEDGWCDQLVRGRVVIERPSNKLSFVVWLKRESSSGPTALFTLSADGSQPDVHEVPFEEPSTISLERPLEKGDEVSFRIFCNHRVAEAGGDGRHLSFVIHEVTV